MISESMLIWGNALAVTGAVVLGYMFAVRRRGRLDRERLDEARRLGVDTPKGQYPYIDPDVCIGCGGCIRACPEGDVLGIVAARTLRQEARTQAGLERQVEEALHGVLAPLARNVAHPVTHQRLEGRNAARVLEDVVLHRPAIGESPAQCGHCLDLLAQAPLGGEELVPGRPVGVALAGEPLL